jgi:hypothetical protein
MLTILIVCIQVYAPAKQLNEDTVNVSEEEVEEFVMTENPLFEKEKEGFKENKGTRAMGHIETLDEDRFTDESLIPLYERDDAPASWNSIERSK